MTQEEKELLLTDLCARLPYGVKYKDRIDRGVHILTLGIISYYERFIPYLRPMSSMTEEERNSVENWNWNIGCRDNETVLAYFDWLNKKGFDYRGLIPMGLALEAPEDMYKTK